METSVHVQVYLQHAMGTMAAPCMQHRQPVRKDSKAKQVGHQVCAVTEKPIEEKQCTPLAVMIAEGMCRWDCVAGQGALTAEGLQPDLTKPVSSVQRHYISLF